MADARQQDSHAHNDHVFKVLSNDSAAAFSDVAASWCRSGVRHGLDPATLHERNLISGAELARLREKNGLLIEAARPLMDQLFTTVGAAGCAVMLSDAGGIILESRVMAADRMMFDEVGLTPGGIWGEETEGTNGIGTCLVERRPVTIYRDEHFASRNIGISCMDAPIYDAQGQLVGALDISSCRDDHSQAVATMVQKIVQDAARRIERSVFYHHFSGHRIIDANEPGGDAALLAVDLDDLLIGATRAARLRFALTDDCMNGTKRAASLLGEDSAVSFEDAERTTLRKALAESGGNASAAAKLLGIGRATLYRRLEKAGIAPSGA